MRMLRITAAALLAVMVTLAGPVPARAGGFATTVLDPLPAKIEPGVAYTIGYWVLQHGSHPYSGDLETALVLTDDKGTVTSYPGKALPEPAHYAAAVVFGRAGTWRVAVNQGWFGPYQLGTAGVPGAFTVAPTPTEFAGIEIDYKHWDAVRPPQAPGAAPQKAVQVPVAAEAEIGSAPPPPRGGSWGAALIGGGVLVAAAGALFLTRRRGRQV